MNFSGIFFSRFKIRFNDFRILNDIKEKSTWKITAKDEEIFLVILSCLCPVRDISLPQERYNSSNSKDDKWQIAMIEMRNVLLLSSRF